MKIVNCNLDVVLEPVEEIVYTNDPTLWIIGALIVAAALVTVIIVFKRKK